MDACTNNREPATHDCPLPSKMPSATAATAASTSASANRIWGDLPPNSSATGISFLAAISPMRLPLSVPPVKDTIRTKGWATSAAPAPCPVPGRTFRIPSGSPACNAMRATASPVEGVTSDGLRMTALPAARAGAIFCASMGIGEFHGVVERHRQVITACRRYFGAGDLAHASVITERRSRTLYLPAALTPNLAVFLHLQPCEHGAVALDAIRNAEQNTGTLHRQHFAPSTVRAGRGGVAHRKIHRFRACCGHFVIRLPRRRVDR